MFNSIVLILVAVSFVVPSVSDAEKLKKFRTRIVQPDEPVASTTAPPEPEDTQPASSGPIPTAIFQDEHGYAIPDQNFNPRLATDSEKYRHQYKVPEAVSGFKPRGVHADWSARTEADIHYDQAAKEGLRRGYVENRSAYIPIRTLREAYAETHDYDGAIFAMRFSEFMGKQVAEASRTGKPLDHVKAREEFMKDAAWEYVKGLGGDIPIPVLNSAIRGGLLAADADLKYKTQEKVPANYDTITSVIAGDNETMKLAAAKAADTLEHTKLGMTLSGSVMSDAEIDSTLDLVGTVGRIEINRYLRSIGAIQLAGEYTPENIQAMNPDYANSERLKHVAGVVDWLKTSQQEIQKSLDDIDTRTVATEFKVSAIGVMLQKLNEKSDKAFQELKEADRRLQAQMEAMGGDLTATKNGVTEIQKYLLAKEDKERKQQEYEQSLSLYDSAAGLIPQFAGLTKNKQIIKAAQKMSQVVKVGKKVHQLMHVAETLGKANGIAKAAFTMNLASVGFEIAGLFSNQKDMDTQILEAIKQMTKEMHERFDRLETMLQDIDKRMVEHFGRMEEALAHLRIDVREANERLSVIQGDLVALMDSFGLSLEEIRAMQQDQQLLQYEQLVEHAIEKRIKHPQLTVNANAFLGELTDFNHWATNAPRKSPFLLPVTVYSQRPEALKASLSPFRQFNLNQSLAIDNAWFGIKAPKISTIPDLASWRRAAEHMVQYIMLHPEHDSIDVRRDLTEVAEVGIEIREAVEAARHPDRVTKVLEEERKMAVKLIEKVRDDWQAMASRNLVPYGKTAKEWLATKPTVGPKNDPVAYPYDPAIFIERPTVSFGGGKVVLGDSAGVIMPPGLRLLSQIRKANRKSDLALKAELVVKWKKTGRFSRKVPTFSYYHPQVYLMLSSPHFDGTVRTAVVKNSKVFYSAAADYYDAEDPNDVSVKNKRVGYYEEAQVDETLLDAYLAKNLATFFAEAQAGEWQNGVECAPEQSLFNWLDKEVAENRKTLKQELATALNPNHGLARLTPPDGFHHVGFQRAVSMSDDLRDLAQVAQWRFHNLNFMAPELVGAFAEKYKKEWQFGHFVANALAEDKDPDTIIKEVNTHAEQMNDWFVSEFARTENTEDRYGIVDDVLAKLNAIQLLKERDKERDRLVDAVIESLKEKGVGVR